MKPTTIARLGAVLLGAILPLSANPPAANASLSQCTSGYMCVWSESGYSGSIKKVSATNSYKSIGFSTVGSYYNNRTKRTYLHEKTDGSGSYSCISAGSKAASVSGWKTHAKAVYLSTTTSC